MILKIIAIVLAVAELMIIGYFQLRDKKSDDTLQTPQQYIDESIQLPDGESENNITVPREEI